MNNSGKPPAGKKAAPGRPGMNRQKPYGRPAADRQRTGRPPQNGQRTGRPQEKKAPAIPEGMESRRAALRVLREVTEEGKYASLSLDANLRKSGLSEQDRRLVTRLAYDTLDRMIYLDYILDQVMARKDTDIRLKNILRLGACQILLEDRIPESAATNTSVQLCTELGMEGLKGVCNGILRNLIRRKDELVIAEDPGDEQEELQAVYYSLPLWLWRRLKADYGEDAPKAATCREEDTRITVRPNLNRLDGEAFEALLAKKVWKSRRGSLPYSWQIQGAMDIAEDSDFRKGMFSIQTEGSMMICMALEPRRGDKILDCCAAPGGKSCFLAEMMDGTGRIQAWDVHEHRVDLIAAQARRLSLDNIRPMVRDATKRREDLDGTMDAVLLDAPCSGIGVVAGKPDIKLRMTAKKVEEITELQTKLLDTVCAYVRPGGTLLYSTCSVLKEENERQVTSFLEKHPDFECVPLPECIPERFRRYEGTGLQLLPWRDGTEGFYFCRMKRKAGV